MITPEDLNEEYFDSFDYDVRLFLKSCQEEGEYITYIDRPLCTVDSIDSFSCTGDIRGIVQSMLDDLEYQKTPLPYDVWFRMCRKYMNKDQWGGFCYETACEVLPNVPHEAPTPEQEEAARNMPPRVPDLYW